MIPVQIVYTFLMGMVAAIVYKNTRTLIYPVIIHVVNNFCNSITEIVLSQTLRETIDIL